MMIFGFVLFLSNYVYFPLPDPTPTHPIPQRKNSDFWSVNLKYITPPPPKWKTSDLWLVNSSEQITFDVIIPNSHIQILNPISGSLVFLFSVTSPGLTQLFFEKYSNDRGKLCLGSFVNWPKTFSQTSHIYSVVNYIDRTWGAARKQI